MAILPSRSNTTSPITSTAAHNTKFIAANPINPETKGRFFLKNNVKRLTQTLKASLGHIRRLKPHRADRFLALDEVTRRSLELTRTLRDNSRDGSLLASSTAR